MPVLLFNKSFSMNVKWLLALTVTVAAIAGALVYNFHIRNDVNLHVSWNNESGKRRVERTYVQVPEGDYEDVFEEIIGSDHWNTAKQLYRQQAGLTRFMTGDVFSVTTSGNKAISFDLHHYKNRAIGEEISFLKKGNRYEKKVSEISLEVKTVVKFFKIKKSLLEDNPQFYEIARERLVWDWGILDKLMPDDTVSFMVKGIFDKDILVHTFGILGFSVRSGTLGDFTMTAFRDATYGDYFVSGHRMMLSPVGQFRAPIDSGRISSSYGYRKDPFNKRKRFHNGVDIIAKKDTPVRAADSGVVSFVGKKGNFGNAIVLEHGNGMKTIYGHLNRFLVTSGMTVQKGEVIAGVGNTGRSTAPHLHFTVLLDGKSTDPMQFTYERVWSAPFDIAGGFRNVSSSRAAQLEEVMDKGKTTFIQEKYADLMSSVN